MKKRVKKAEPLKLNLNEVKFETDKLPWPLKSNSVDEVVWHYGLQRVAGPLRGKLMEELFRVLKPLAKATLIVPYYNGMRAIMDYNYEWPPFCEMSFLYFNKGWREANKAPALNCDFDFTYGYTLDGETSTRAQDIQSFWVKHYANAALDLQVILTKREEQ